MCGLMFVTSFLGTLIFLFFIRFFVLNKCDFCLHLKKAREVSNNGNDIQGEENIKIIDEVTSSVMEKNEITAVAYSRVSSSRHSRNTS
jgi:hypothetical protein